MSMCRFPSKDDEGYKQVSGEIRVIMVKIEERLESQRRNKEIVNFQTRAPSEATAGSTPYCMHSRLSFITPFSTSVDNVA